MANFKIFDPMTMDSNMLPNVAGNYVFLLRKGSQLPQVDINPQIPEVTLDGNTYQAIYTGIASKSLRKREYLTGRDSITFYAYQNSESFTIVWQKAVADYIKEIKL